MSTVTRHSRLGRIDRPAHVAAGLHESTGPQRTYKLWTYKSRTPITDYSACLAALAPRIQKIKHRGTRELLAFPKFGLFAAPRGRQFDNVFGQRGVPCCAVPRSPKGTIASLTSFYSGPLKGAYGSFNGRTETTLNCGAAICWSSNLRNAVMLQVVVLGALGASWVLSWRFLEAPWGCFGVLAIPSWLGCNFCEPPDLALKDFWRAFERFRKVKTDVF